MAAGGCTYQQIADELGYANRGTVHRLVREALEAQQVESIDLLRAVEVQRLDALQASLWPAALAGDVEAATACLRIILARVKVLGLVETGNGKRISCQQSQTVILQEDDCRTRGCPEHT
jgi:ABC-type phosphate/phosphonate transport system permease subunit